MLHSGVGFCGVDVGGVDFVDEVFEEGDFLAEIVELAGIVRVGISAVGVRMGMHAVGVGVRGGEGDGGGEEEGDGEDDGGELHHDRY